MMKNKIVNNILSVLTFIVGLLLTLKFIMTFGVVGCFIALPITIIVYGVLGVALGFDEIPEIVTNLVYMFIELNFVYLLYVYILIPYVIPFLYYLLTIW